MNSENVFLVDDDFIFKTAALILLKRAHPECDFLYLKNGLEAYNKLKSLIENEEDFPKLILLDINMPVMNGWEFLDALKECTCLDDKNLNVHMLTSSIADEDINRAKEYDFVKGYITKPFTQQDISNLKIA